jgi:hypothetical protein
MQFNLTASGQGILQDIDFLCGSNSSTYAITDKVRNINNAYQDVARLIWSSDAYWAYDDQNNSDLPLAYRTMADASASYEIPSTAQRIERVEVMGSTSAWWKLEPIDYKDVGMSMKEYEGTAGMPKYYDLVGSQITLYPAPSDDETVLTSGLCIYLTRDVNLFTTASTTSTPGFNSQFHRILSYAAALDFEKDQNARNLLIMQKSRLEKGLVEFYGSRHAERKPEMTPFGKRNWRQYL